MVFDPNLADDVSIVRLAVGDTDDHDPILQEATYEALVALYPSAKGRAAAAAARSIAAKYARDVSHTAGKTRVEAQQRREAYEKLAKRLDRTGDDPLGASGRYAVAGMRVGGAVEAENETLRENSAYARPSFVIGDFDDPRIGSLVYEDEDDDEAS